MEEKKNREIDIIGSILKVFKEWKLLLKISLVAAIIGVVVALNIQKRYTTTVLLAPEVSNMPSSSLSSLGSMIGVNFGASMTSDAIYPELYPEIISSTDFAVALFDVPVTPLDADTCLPYHKHLIASREIPFWEYPRIWYSKLKKKIDGDKSNVVKEKLDPYHLTKAELAMLEWIESNITINVDKKTGVITLNVTDYDPQVSALMADTVMTRLQNYVVDYRTKKARHDLEYINELYEQAKTEYLEAQKVYAQVFDSNRNVYSKSASSNMEYLENEMQLKLAVYTETAQQLQMARAKVQEQMPVFTVLQSATVPVNPSSVSKTVVVLSFIIIGVFLGAIWILFLRDIYRKNRKSKSVA